MVLQIFFAAALLAAALYALGLVAASLAPGGSFKRMRREGRS